MGSNLGGRGKKRETEDVFYVWFDHVDGCVLKYNQEQLDREIKKLFNELGEKEAEEMLSDDIKIVEIVQTGKTEPKVYEVDFTREYVTRTGNELPFGNYGVDWK